MGKHSLILTQEQMDTEEWREISDFPVYAVSEYGRVKRIKEGGSNIARIGHILSPGFEGYYLYTFV